MEKDALNAKTTCSVGGLTGFKKMAILLGKQL